MSEEYGNASFIRRTEDVTRAKKGSGPKKARYTGLSIASLRENIRLGRLEAKIAKYNREYEELWNLAKEVNSDRQDLEEGKVGFAEVSESIERYNKQARKLAEIGVQVMAFDKDIRKINLDIDSQVKAIRVPGFLIGPLRMLSAAGRERARAEKLAAEVKKQNEETMYDAIVAVAQNAIGQKPEDIASKEGMMSLRPEELATTIKTGLGMVEPVKVEEPVAEPAQPVVEKPVEPAVEPVKADDSKKKAALAGAMGAAYKKKNAEVASAVSAIKEDDVFAIVGHVNNNFGVKLIEKNGKAAEMLYVRGPEKNVVLAPSEFAKMAGIESGNKEEIFGSYKSFIAVAKVAKLWRMNAAKEVVYYNRDGEVVDTSTIDPTTTIDLRASYVGAFDEDRKSLFDFVVTSIEDGLTEEELLAKANETLSQGDAEVVASVVKGNYAVLESGLKGLKTFMVEEPVKAQEVEPEVQPVVEVSEDSIAKKKSVVDAKLTELGMQKYGKKAVDVTPEVEVAPEVVPVVEEQEVEVVPNPVVDFGEAEEPIAPEVRPAEGSYVDQINKLVDDIAALSKARDGLREALGDEASEQLSTLEQAISDKLAQINALALGGIVSLGKDGDKKDVEQENVVVQEEAPVVPEVVHEEEKGVEVPAVEEEQHEEQTLKEVVEEAVLSKTGSHIIVNINLGNVYNQGGNFAINIGDGLNVQVIGGSANVEVPVVGEDAEVVTPVVPEVASETVSEIEIPVVAPRNDAFEADLEQTVVIAPDENPAFEQQQEETAVEEEQDLEHRDAIMWWNEMVPFLDKPQWEKDLAAERADRKIEDMHFEENKQARIEADKAAREARREENKEKRARSMLAAYGMSTEALDAMEKGAEAGEMTPYQFLEKLKVEDTKTYEHIVSNYIEVKRNELSELTASLKAEGRLPESETSVGPFKR